MNAEVTGRSDRARRAAVLASLGDPTRLAVVDLLRGQDMSPDGLSAALGVPGNLLAHHLGVLERAGVIARVHSQHDRRRTYVQLVGSSLDGLLPEPGRIEAPRIVFVCTHNSARSVLAEAIWASMSEVPVASAGTAPAARVNPRARAAARRAGLTLLAERPRHVDDVLRDDDVLVSVCDSVNEQLGPRPNERLHWSVPDPSVVGTDSAFTDAVLELRARVAELTPRVRYHRSTRRRRST